LIFPQPLSYSGKVNATIVSEGMHLVSGVVVGLMASASSSALPVIAASCPLDLLWPLMTWQAVAAAAASMAGKFWPLTQK
jgi:hypothetical protein